nr:retrovirus-related Pol polyprotein from transposon TNT 1-94 [Tanacetum cinerariifolium]
MNGDEPVQTTRDKNGVKTEVPSKTAQAILKRQRKRKANSILLLAIPDEYQLSLLEVHGATGSNENANQKFLRAKPSSWNNIALIMRNTEGIDKLDIDDLYNNLKLFKVDIKGHSSSRQASSSSYTDDLMFLFFAIQLNKTSDALVVQDNALIVQDGLEYDWSYIAQEEPTKFALMAYTSGSDTEEKNAVLEFEVKDKVGLSFARLDDSVYRPTANKASASISESEPSVIKTSNISVEMPKVNSVRTSSVIIEDWIEFTKARNESVKSDKQVDKPKMVTQNSKADRKDYKVSTVEGNEVTAVKTSVGESTTSFKVQRNVDSGFPRHMTWNKALLTDYQDIDGGFVTFGGSTKCGKTTGIGKIRTNKIYFEDVFFVKELKFNLFFVSQMRDKKNSVLFTESECLVLSPDFKLIDESQNKTLIEATRTMLPDSLLPTIFWAEAVNTACYVLNRVLVTKPHNKTPYELIIGRPPSISFMRPFECPITILNTLDPLGKFDGKAKEGFLIGYSVNSKAFRVFNTQTRKVKENLHLNFLKNKPNVAGQGPNWLFDIDTLANSMNYQPITAGNQANKNVGQQEVNGDTGLKKNINVGHTEQEKVSTQQYIVFPLWSSISLSYKSLDDKARDNTADDSSISLSYKSLDDKARDNTADDVVGKEKVQELVSEYDQDLKNVLEMMMNQ